MKDKPLMFWIINDRAMPDGAIVPDKYKLGIHVIEKSAYDQACKERDDYREYIDAQNEFYKKALKDRDEWYHKAGAAVAHLTIKDFTIKRLEKKIDDYREALEKIADPRKRDHQEPDKYTEVGCMIHMADEVLAKYLKADNEK